jgi:protein TonB
MNLLFWTLALIGSLLIHSFIFSFAKPLSLQAPLENVHQITHLRFAAMKPPVKQTEQAKPHTQIEPKPKKSKPESKAKPKPKPKQKPRPKRKQVKKPKPVTKPPEVIKAVLPKPEPAPAENTMAKKIAVNKQPANNLNPLASATLARPDTGLQQQRESYRVLLMRHINAHKHYPMAARRLNIEDVINISFILHKNGSFSKPVITGNKSILIKAARHTLDKAKPFPAPPADLKPPVKISFKIRYNLR